MHLIVVQRGKIRDRAIRALRDEYHKRFRRFGRLELRERSGDGKLWPEEARWRILLDEGGESVPSHDLAQRLAQWSMQHGCIAFLIGDAYGHSEASRADADWRLALGPLTMPHQLAHVVLVEQLYRAATIQAGHPYHHG